jgi:hypothetical protein
VALLLRILTSSLTGISLSLALISPGPASAAAPPSAFVRIEGAGATLLPQTLIQTTNATKIKGKACAGSSAAGALNAAAAGSWSGSYSASFKDYLVGSILGEAPAGQNFWTLWVNGRSSSTGACSTPLHPGDHELWFDCQADANFNCTNDPLALKLPAAIRLGRATTATVTQLDGAGHSTAVPGAAITGTGVAAVSGASGKATFVARRAGVITVQAAKSGATPSDPAFVCVYRTRSTQCGSAALNGPPVHVAGIHEHQALAKGPRELRGTAGPDPSGLTDVSLSLLRHAPGGRCSYYDGERGTWQASSCHPAKAIPSFSAGANAAWSYLLPAPLPAGSYHLNVVASDGNGRRTKLVRGVSALDFSVTAGTKSKRSLTAAAAAAPPTVQMMVIGRKRTLLSARSEKLSATSVKIGHRRCSVPAGTPLAGLLKARLAVRVTDAAGCDPTALFVTRVGGDANAGPAGWVYKVGRTSPSPGAGDPSGRLKARQQLLWFWCTRASACSRTLAVQLPAGHAAAGTPLQVHVVGYDDNGHGRAISQATVKLGPATAITGAGGVAQLTAPATPGHYALSATKQGAVPSFPAEVTIT